MMLVFSQTSLRSRRRLGGSEAELKLLPGSYKDGDCMLSHKALGMVESTTALSRNSNPAHFVQSLPSDSLAASVGLEPTQLLAQSNQDVILGKIFEAIGVKHKQCVEFGKSCLSLHPSTVSFDALTPVYFDSLPSRLWIQRCPQHDHGKFHGSLKDCRRPEHTQLDPARLGRQVL